MPCFGTDNYRKIWLQHASAPVTSASIPMSTIDGYHAHTHVRGYLRRLDATEWKPAVVMHLEDARDEEYREGLHRRRVSADITRSLNILLIHQQSRYQRRAMRTTTSAHRSPSLSPPCLSVAALRPHCPIASLWALFHYRPINPALFT
jgi:hypothetical protein